MTTSHSSTEWVEDLAGAWTDPALEILKASGVPVSVDVELAVWRSLKRALQSELQHAYLAAAG